MSWTLWDDLMATVTGALAIVLFALVVYALGAALQAGWGVPVLMFVVCAFLVGRAINKWLFTQ